jgi:hypothetical protein
MALYSLLKQKSQAFTGPEMKTIVDYARQAHEGNKADPKVKEHYEQVKREYEGSSSQEEEKRQEPENEPTIIEETKSSPYAYSPASSSPSTYVSPPVITPEKLKEMPPEEKVKLV